VSLGESLNKLVEILPQILLTFLLAKIIFNEIMHLMSIEISKNGKVVYEIRLSAEESLLKKLSDELKELLEKSFGESK
jgi:phosphotransferase system HPr-like phosphotransfer protein